MGFVSGLCHSWVRALCPILDALEFGLDLGRRKGSSSGAVAGYALTGSRVCAMTSREKTRSPAWFIPPESSISIHCAMSLAVDVTPAGIQRV